MDTALTTSHPTQLFDYKHLDSAGGTASAHPAGGAEPHSAAATGSTLTIDPLEKPKPAAVVTTIPSSPFPSATEQVASPVSTELPRLDQLPLEVLNLVASLVAPPFYTPPAPEDIQYTPEPYVITSTDPQPPSPKTVSAELSAITKTCSHVLEASRPWLWENLDIRGGKGWLAVVDALTEIVHDDEEEPISPGVGSDRSPGESPFRPASAALAGVGAGAPQHAELGKASSSLIGSGSVTPPPDSPASDEGTLTHSTVMSVPVGSGGFPFHRSVTLDRRLPSERPRTSSSVFPQPRRLSILQNTPPGSRNASPSSNANARLRGRSRSPRRGLDFDTEGISAVLSRSLSLSLPGGYHPLMRQSSLSRVLRPFDDPPSPESITPPEPFLPDENPNPEMLPPPGPYIRHLSFTNFRTIGARRSQKQAVEDRFVTAGRFEGVIKNAPNLRTIFMTEYVDSALAYPVVEEIFFRGYAKPRVFRPRSTSFSPNARPRSVSVHPAAEQAHSTIEDQHDPPRPVYVPYEDETEEQKWHRRRMFTPIEALDLTGCVSHAFTQAAKQFGDNWLDLGIDEEDDDGEERGRSRNRRRRAESSTEEDEEDDARADRPAHHPKFQALRRLSLRTCTTLRPEFIQALTLCMPNLTHLDLSGTIVDNSLLRALTYNPPRGMRLQSLSLARCPHIHPRTVVDFLIESPAAKDLLELNLFVHPTQTNSIESEDLFRLLKEAPCIRSGRLRYLDLSSAGFTPEHLAEDVFPPQPSLISLGLCHVPGLPLREIATFLQNSASGVEVLALTGTSTMDLRPEATSLQTTLTLHALLINPLTTVPFSLSGFNFSSSGRSVDLAAGPTRLRAVELSGAIRRSLVGSQGSGRTEWQVVKSKLGRGWYVDVSAGWIPSDTVDQWGFISGGNAPTAGEGRSALTFVRHLPASHIRRQWLAYLAEADGRVATDVGWHSRKMEVIKGYGMMGREEGMGGKGAFSSNE